MGVENLQVQELEVLSSLVPFIARSKTYLQPETFKPGTFKLLLSKFRLILGFIYNQSSNSIPDVSTSLDSYEYDPQNEAGLPPVASRQQAARELGLVECMLELIQVAGIHLLGNLASNDENEFQVWMRRMMRVSDGVGGGCLFFFFFFFFFCNVVQSFF